MAKTKREYILATCFLSGAAAILSLVALGTQEWVTSDVGFVDNSAPENGSFIKVGLFGGVFNQKIPTEAVYDLTTICAWDLNICALLCGDDAEDDLRKLYNKETVNDNYEVTCPKTIPSDSSRTIRRITPRASPEEGIFINTGMWFCTILFLLISALMGLFSAGLAVWNTATNPYQVYLSVFGLYIYNAIALFAILLSIILWGAMFAQDLTHFIPTYKTFLQSYVSDGYAQLGYSYWINLASLFLYIGSICLLYIRNYLISKEPKVNLQLEDSADPVIYLY